MAYTTIDDPEAHFQAVIYTGDGSANHAITLPGDTNMQPDFVWIKNRDATDAHCLFDSVRGATKLLSSDATTAETTDADTLDSFATDGFQVDADVKVNTNAEDYVAWCWKAGGSASTDDAGSIDSSTSTSTTAGFSIATWTSTAAAHTIGHSLGVVPAMIIMKGRHESNSWQVYHHKNTSAPETDYLDLSTTDATADYTVWNDTAPTSTVMSLGTWSGLDDNGTMVAYIFAPKQGFSKFGSYTGNGSTNGPFVYTGFRPAFLMVKKSSDTGNWVLSDNKRVGYNQVGHTLYANTTGAELAGDGVYFDLLSNGFKIRDASGANNTSGGTYIYIAFAEAPFVNSEGVPNNAR